jgi:hypothetical protein
MGKGRSLRRGQVSVWHVGQEVESRCTITVNTSVCESTSDLPFTVIADCYSASVDSPLCQETRLKGGNDHRTRLDRWGLRWLLSITADV